MLALCGPGDDRVMDTLVKVVIGSEDPEEKIRVDTLGLPPGFSTQVVESLIHTAMEIGAEGYEGHAVGTIIVIGDSTAVMEKSRQLILNPFQGISEAERNALDPPIREAMKTFSALDGAFIIREDGVVLAAGRYLLTMSRDVKLPMGLGARHSAAASISAESKAIAITVSQTTGTVRVFSEGEIALELPARSCARSSARRRHGARGPARGRPPAQRRHASQRSLRAPRRAGAAHPDVTEREVVADRVGRIEPPQRGGDLLGGAPARVRAGR